MDLKDSIPVAITRDGRLHSNDVMYAVVAFKRVKAVKDGDFIDYVAYPDSIIDVINF